MDDVLYLLQRRVGKGPLIVGALRVKEDSAGANVGL